MLFQAGGQALRQDRSAGVRPSGAVSRLGLCGHRIQDWCSVLLEVELELVILGLWAFFVSEMVALRNVVTLAIVDNLVHGVL